MGIFRKTLLAGIVIPVFVFIGNLLLGGSPAAPVMRDGWFGRGARTPDVDTSIVPFSISVPDEELDDLQRRLSNIRLGEDLENVKFEYGVQVGFMREVIKYWQNDYDWRQHEEILNQFPQFKTNVEGIDLHFIHVKPTRATGRVLMMTHGWPGSVYEFYKILPMLTDPGSHGGDPSEAFEVICPSIPGFGYSEAAHQPGMEAAATARMYVELMERLGHTRFYLQGGDFGANINTIIAQAYPHKVQGIHLNTFAPPRSSPETNIKHMIANFFPSLLGITDWEYEKTYPLSKLFTNLLSVTGYMHIQSTKPDTIAFSLNDSPVGLAAYILEKFGGWTNKERHLNSLDGAITEKFTLDELLTNVMIYWTTQTIGSSVRYFKENLGGSELMEAWNGVKVTVPAGLAAFPHEIVGMPKAMAEIRFKNILQYTMMPRGGHFAALEEPRLLVDDLLAFVRKVEQK